MDLLTVSSYLYGAAFVGYLIATIFYVAAGVSGKLKKDTEPSVSRWPKWGYWTLVIGVIAQGLAITTRAIHGKYIPVSNMFEYMSFWAFAIMLAFVIINAFYKIPMLGAFVAPVGLLVLAYASVFPREHKPLIPALQSYWLNIHVTTAALAEGVLVISFAAGLMYLLRTTDVMSRSRSAKGLEFTMFLFIALLAYTALASAFAGAGYSVIAHEGTIAAMEYKLPPIVGPTGTELGSITSFAGVPLPLFNTPEWMRANDAPKQLNTIVWTLLGALALYGLLRLLLRKPLAYFTARWVRGMNPDTLDELSYRAVAIGMPLFTLGALIFAMIWAQEAWGSYWSWDPKETWALITWLYYAAYLHLRLRHGWEGKKSAWLAVAGFVLVMFLLVGVNLIISGMHSYANS